MSSSPSTPSGARRRGSGMLPPPPSVTPSGLKSKAKARTPANARSHSLTPSKRRQQESKRQWLTSPPKRARDGTPGGPGDLDEPADEDEGGLAEGCIQRLFPEAHQESGREKKGNEEEKTTGDGALGREDEGEMPVAKGKSGESTPGLAPSTVVCSPSVKRAYSIVRRCTGSLGGNGSGGAIYGELTSGSMQKVVDLMVAHCNLNKDSLFIDVGSGLGKPNIHVAQDPGVAVSYGIEHEEVRWYLGLHNLKHLLDEAASQCDGHGDSIAADALLKHKIFFQYGDIMDADTLDPFTHVYMFDIGFPPTLFEQLSAMYNRSRSPKWLICYHGPKLIVEKYGFHVELLAQKPTSMHGSAEGHTVYLYRHVFQEEEVVVVDGRPHVADSLFSEGLGLLQRGSLSELREWVERQLQKQLVSPRPDRKAKAKAASPSIKLNFTQE